jgi:HD-like signal output (HDOD) protein
MKELPGQFDELPVTQQPVGPEEWSRLVARFQTLPSYHPTALTLLAISTETDSAIDEFDAVFQSDAGFAAALLQVANSAEFGVRGRIESIRQALTFLGVERVSSLAFSLAMRFYMEKLPGMREMQRVWAHSIATAVVASAIASACGVRTAGISTAGLVHDIGRLGLLMVEGKPYTDFTSQEFDSTKGYLLAEQILFDMNHTFGAREK